MKWFIRTFDRDAGGAGAGAGGAGAQGGAASGGAAAAGAASGQQAAASGQGGEQGGAASGGQRSLADTVAAKVQELGGAPAGQDGGQQQQQPGQQQAAKQPGQQEPPGAYFPDALPQDLRGTNDRETIDKLLGKLPKPPAKAEDYKFTPDNDFLNAYGDLKDDPALPVFRQVAHKHGIGAEQFSGIISDFYKSLTDAGLIEGPLDAEAEVAKLAGDKGLPRERYAKAHQRIGAVQNFVKDLVTQRVLTKQDAVILGAMSSSAESVMAFEKIMALIPGEHGVQGGGQGAGQYSWQQADIDMADERYSSTSPKYDPAFRSRVDGQMSRLPSRKSRR